KHATIAALNIRMVHTSLLSQLRLTARLAVLTDLREQFENCLANSIIIARTGEFLKVIHRLGVQRRGLEPVRDSNDPIAQLLGDLGGVDELLRQLLARPQASHLDGDVATGYLAAEADELA